MFFKLPRGDFNPRPRKEGDRHTVKSFHFSVYFNPRPRKEGDTFEGVSKTRASYFNPRPRKEGDSIMLQYKFPMTISIHALAKRATSFAVRFAVFVIVFQSTPSQRGRQHKIMSMKNALFISIHALAKRATLRHS